MIGNVISCTLKRSQVRKSPIAMSWGSASDRVARVAHVSERLAGALTLVAAAGLAVGTLTAFALTRTRGGLFNFQERGLQPAPQALIALVAEVGVLVVIGAWLLARQLASPEVHTASVPRV